MTATNIGNRFLALTIMALVGGSVLASAQTVAYVELKDDLGNVIIIDASGAVATSGKCSSVGPCSTTGGSVSNFPSPGTIHFSGTIGNFSVIGAEAQTNAGIPNGIDLGLGTVLSTVGGQLTGEVTVQNLLITGPVRLETQIAGGTALNSVYIDPANGLFTDNISPLISQQWTVLNSCTGTAFNCVPFNGSTAASSITLVAVAQIPPGGSFTNDLGFFATSIQGAPLKSICHGDTATIGFWHNKNGQALINSMNGGASSKALATWLATNFPNLYGANAGSANLTGKTNADVAALFITFFNVKGANTSAQIMAGALAVYVTNTALGGTTAAAYGFNTSSTGTGSKTFNVGSDGTGAGLTNNTSYTILQLVQQANAAVGHGTFNSTVFNDIFNGINQTGDIN